MTFTNKETQILAREAKQHGCETSKDFLDIQAGQWRLALLAMRGHFDRDFANPDDAAAFAEKLRNVKMPVRNLDGRPDGWEVYYLIFEDGSLYFGTNAEDEVWAFADDFVSKRLLTAETWALHEIDIQLINHERPSYFDETPLTFNHLTGDLTITLRQFECAINALATEYYCKELTQHGHILRVGIEHRSQTRSDSGGITFGNENTAAKAATFAENHQNFQTNQLSRLDQLKLQNPYYHS